MKTFSVGDTQIPPSSKRQKRRVEEDKGRQAVKVDGRTRRRLHRTEQVLLRMTPDRRTQLERLAEALSAGKETPVSFAETVERGLDLLEQSIKGTRSVE